MGGAQELETIKKINIFKQDKLYAKLINGKFFKIDGNGEVPYDGAEILDILPEGIDLEIMKKSFNLKDDVEILPYIKNSIGDFSFSSKEYMPERIEYSNIDEINCFPNILDLKISLDTNKLRPSIITSPKNKEIQNLSLSGYQHKLQVKINNNEIVESYADYILKPCSSEYSRLSVNEHLHMQFMGELGFEMPHNFIVYDERFRDYHYLVKRFDIQNGKKLPQISLNALMKSYDKYKGSIEEIAKELANKLNEAEKYKFINFVYTNALIFNNDLHKKNISFLIRDKQLVLSPVYDVINIYPIKGLKDNQCILPINGKLDNIRISYFKQASENLEIAFEKVKENLVNIREKYLELYPKYINLLDEMPILENRKELKHKLKESYDKVVRIENTRFKCGEVAGASDILESGGEVSKPSDLQIKYTANQDFGKNPNEIISQKEKENQANYSTKLKELESSLDEVKPSDTLNEMVGDKKHNKDSSHNVESSRDFKNNIRKNR